jgi:hypothetical protein
MPVVNIEFWDEYRAIARHTCDAAPDASWFRGSVLTVTPTDGPAVQYYTDDVYAVYANPIKDAN